MCKTYSKTIKGHKTRAEKNKIQQVTRIFNLKQKKKKKKKKKNWRKKNLEKKIGEKKFGEKKKRRLRRRVYKQHKT